MMIEVEDYLDVRERAEALGCELGSIITFLPSNLDIATSADDFIVRGEITTIRKVLNFGGVPSSMLSAKGAPSPGFVHNKSHDWAVPIIFIGAEMLKTAPDIVSVTIDLIRDYALDLFKGIGADKKVKAEIVVERSQGRTYQKVTYEGDVSGLNTLAEMVSRISGENDLSGHR